MYTSDNICDVDDRLKVNLRRLKEILHIIMNEQAN